MDSKHTPSLPTVEELLNLADLVKEAVALCESLRREEDSGHGDPLIIPMRRALTLCAALVSADPIGALERPRLGVPLKGRTVRPAALLELLISRARYLRGAELYEGQWDAWLEATIENLEADCADLRRARDE